MAGPITITCSGCGVAFPVPARVVRILGHRVVVHLDRSAIYGHRTVCTGPDDIDPAAEVSKAVAIPDKPQPDPALAGRITMMLTGGHFMAKGGSGACTMCGVTRDGCLQQLQPLTLPLENGKPAGTVPGKPCCAVCGDGNTHPAPQEAAQTCAQWAVTHGARN